MPCHPPFPLMEFWSLKPPRSRQEEKVFPRPNIFYIFIHIFYVCGIYRLTEPPPGPGLLRHQVKFLTF